MDKCENCGSDDDVQWVAADDDIFSGDLLCNDCRFTCCSCRSLSPVKQRKMIVVIDDNMEVSPGVYRIVRRRYMPFFNQNHVAAGWLQPESMERIGDLPEIDPNYDYWPCGHLCAECQRKVLSRK